MALTFLRLKEQAAKIAKDIGYNMSSEEDYEDAINEALMRISRQAKIFTKTAILSCPAGEQAIALPDNYLSLFTGASRSPVRFTNEVGRNIYLRASTKREIMNRSEDWDNKTGDPECFWIDGNGTINLVPIPEFEGTDNLRIDYIAMASTLVENEDISEFTDKWLYAIAYMTASIISADNELPQDAKLYENEANLRMNELVVTGENYQIDNAFSIGYIG